MKLRWGAPEKVSGNISIQILFKGEANEGGSCMRDSGNISILILNQNLNEVEGRRPREDSGP